MLLIWSPKLIIFEYSIFLVNAEFFFKENLSVGVKDGAYVLIKDIFPGV